ncbi:Spo0E family sporulation regulatory protein-aspartic acid phosphatase [Brevibacillus borstelensis]|uniref:Spo0E family sporulation regulatory protein-aspartic acid phosphatase n=1 Tax=Brevibacillus borstelensis TaxID=45462 RepID=UPI0030BB8C23
MGGSADELHNMTIGDIIKRYRERENLTITQLTNISGVHKDVISKIEFGDMKCPELGTIKPIANVLGISFLEIVEHYIEAEQRVDTLRELLQEAIHFSNQTLTLKVALKLLESPLEETYTAIEQLYDLADTLTDTESKLVLFKLIVKFAREQNIPQFIAKGLLQAYLIERLDLKRMEESFKDGEEILYYIDFLSKDQKIIFYFRMALQAFAIQKYEHCIELCQSGLALETADTELKARAYLAMINCYYFLDRFDEAEKHLDVFGRFTYDFVSDSTKINRAAIKVAKKQYDDAIPMLNTYLRELGQENRIHVVNELLDIYLETGNMDKITELIEKEEELLPKRAGTPYKHLSIGMYYQRKGYYQVRTGQIDEGMESYINSLKAFEKIHALKEIMKCQIIEDLKKQLHHLVKNKGFQDETVVELSQQLDKYIVLAQRNMQKYRGC